MNIVVDFESEVLFYRSIVGFESCGISKSNHPLGERRVYSFLLSMVIRRSDGNHVALSWYLF
jgi:hypothetical protein